jgi:hypothetical protein
MDTAKNLWLAVCDGSECVVQDDKAYIDAFNASCHETCRLDLTLPPSPFHGFHNAPLVVLEANPLWNEEAVAAYKDPKWRELAFRELHAEQGDRFYALDDQWATSQGGRWWRNCMSGLNRAGYSWNFLATHVLSVEFYGYFSRRWAGIPVTLPSQYFGFHLVTSAMERGAVIVVMRAARFWHVAVPGLLGNSVVANNFRTSSVSRASLGDEGFFRVLRALNPPDEI